MNDVRELQYLALLMINKLGITKEWSWDLVKVEGEAFTESGSDLEVPHMAWVDLGRRKKVERHVKCMPWEFFGHLCIRS